MKLAETFRQGRLFALIGSIRDKFVGEKFNTKDILPREIRFENLTEQNIYAIRAVVNAEVERSRSYNLFIEPAVVEREIYLLTTAINNLGGVAKMFEQTRRDHTEQEYQKLFRFILDVLVINLEEVSKGYYQHFLLNEGGNSPNRFNIHLNSLCGSLLMYLYNNPN